MSGTRRQAAPDPTVGSGGTGAVALRATDGTVAWNDMFSSGGCGSAAAAWLPAIGQGTVYAGLLDGVLASVPSYRAGTGGIGSSGMFQDGYGLVCAGPNFAPAPASARLIGPAMSSMVITPVVSSAFPCVRITMV